MIRRFGCAAVTLALLGLSGGLGASRAAAAPVQTKLDGKRIFAQSQPGVVMVYINVTAPVTLPDPSFNDAKIQALAQQAIALAQSGQIASDQNALVGFMVDQILKDPGAYIVPTDKVIGDTEQTGGQGSGFVVTGNGYVVTNAHVASPNPDELKVSLAEGLLPKFVDYLVQGFSQYLGAQITGDAAKRVQDAAVAYAVKYIQVGKLDEAVYMINGVQPPGLDAAAKGTPVEVVSHGDEWPGKDVAILKVEKNNLLTVPLGDDTAMQTGDSVYAIGYPADATFNPGIAKTSETTPTLTAGVVSAKKTSAAGSPVIQTDVTISPGSSGGPAFDDQGRVIGITTAGSIDQSTGQRVAGENFLVPISVAKDFLARQNVHPEVSQTTQLYLKGLDMVGQSHYSEALKDFQQVNNLAPGLPYVQDQIAKAQQAIDQGQDKPLQAASSSSGGGGTSIGLIAGIAGGAVVLAALIALLVIMRRRPAAPAAAAPAQAPWGGAPPGSVAYQPPPGAGPAPWGAPGNGQQHAPGYAPQTISGAAPAQPGYPPQGAPGYPEQGAAAYPPPAGPPWGAPAVPGYTNPQQPPPGYPPQQPPPGYPPQQWPPQR